MLAAHAFLSARVANELNLTYISAGPTELRLMLIGLTAAMFALGPSDPRVFGMNLFDLFTGAVGAALIAIFLFQTASMVRRLARQGE